MIVIEDSVGYEKGLLLLFQQLQIPANSVLHEWALRRDIENKWKAQHRRKPSTKKAWGKRKLDDLKKGTKADKKAQKDGMTYGSQIDGPNMPARKKAKINTGSKKKSTKKCTACRCGSRTHLTANHKDCPFNTKKKKTASLSASAEHQGESMSVPPENV